MAASNLTAAYFFKQDVRYHDLSADYFERRNKALSLNVLFH
jgi:hypothetical protein